jgi:hypothetical protein
MHDEGFASSNITRDIRWWRSGYSTTKPPLTDTCSTAGASAELTQASACGSWAWRINERPATSPAKAVKASAKLAKSADPLLGKLGKLGMPGTDPHQARGGGELRLWEISRA